MMGLFSGHWMFIIDDSTAKIVITTVKISLDCKGKVVPVHAVWAYEGVEV